MIANEESEKQVSYKTRHKVYCEEMNFEQKNTTALEKDKFDDRAINCYIKHLPTGECAGTIRLVLPTEAGLALPLEENLLKPLRKMNYFLPVVTLLASVKSLALPYRERNLECDSYALKSYPLKKLKS